MGRIQPLRSEFNKHPNKKEILDILHSREMGIPGLDALRVDLIDIKGYKRPQTRAINPLNAPLNKNIEEKKGSIARRTGSGYVHFGPKAVATKYDQKHYTTDMDQSGAVEFSFFKSGLQATAVKEVSHQRKCPKRKSPEFPTQRKR